MSYCKYCGSEVEADSRYCQKCGMPLDKERRVHYENHLKYTPYTVSQRPHLSLSCILAYIPGLFWAPLLTDDKDRKHRQCANQGLWLTVLAVVLGAVVVISGTYILNAGNYQITDLANLFTGWTAANWINKLPYALLCQAFAGLALCVPVNMICGFFGGMASNQPYKIPGLGRISLIKETKDDQNGAV